MRDKLLRDKLLRGALEEFDSEPDLLQRGMFMSSCLVINFDNIDGWAPSLSGIVETLVPKAVFDEVHASVDVSIQEACHLLLELTCRKAVMDAVVGWIESVTVAGYHGTRLTEAESKSVRTNGLLPTKAVHRRARIERSLSHHERWQEVAGRLTDKLEAFGPGVRAGSREGQVHLTLSRSGLVHGFNQYLTHGADIDRHIAFSLLGDEGVELLAKDGQARVIEVVVPGHAALKAANPYWSVEECLATDRVPNLICELLGSWVCRLGDPGFRNDALQLDCGMIFKSTVPPDWIAGIETLP